MTKQKDKTNKSKEFLFLHFPKQQKTVRLDIKENLNSTNAETKEKDVGENLSLTCPSVHLVFEDFVI